MHAPLVQLQHSQPPLTAAACAAVACASTLTAATSAANWVNVTADPRFSITAVNNLAAAAADGTHEW